MNKIHTYNTLDDIHDLIQKKNAEKSKDSPAAIILLPDKKTDHNNAIYGTSLEYDVYLLTKTHYVALKILDKADKIGCELQETKTTLGNRSITVLLISAHADASRIQFGIGSDSTAYYSNPLASDFQVLDPKATIILSCCDVGQDLAKKIASVQDRCVVAPISDLFWHTPFECCEQHGYTMAGGDTDFFMNVRQCQRGDTHQISEKIALCQENADHAYKEKLCWLLQKGDIDQDAQFLIGAYYEYGYAGEKSYEKAFKWYKEAAEQGYPVAQCAVAKCHAKGLGIEKSLEKAFMWYEKAANQGDLAAQVRLGICYADGEGTEKSLEQAFMWYEKAALQGSPTGQCHLGLCYADGLGVEKSSEKAFMWYEKAANQGEATAQFLLAKCYETGTGVKSSLEQALEWYKKAANQGDWGAQIAVRRISTSHMQINSTASFTRRLASVCHVISSISRKPFDLLSQFWQNFSQAVRSYTHLTH